MSLTQKCRSCGSTAFEPRVKATEDVYDQLRSLHTVPESILSTVSQTLADAAKDFAEYESELHRLRISITDVRNRQEKLKVYTENLRSLLSPIRRLPNELLMRIFTFVCSNNDLTRGGHRSSASIISAVCTRWRKLAIGYPQLWSSMTIELCDEEDDGWDPESQAQLEDIIDLYLERSKDRNLSLTFTGKVWSYERDGVVDHPLIVKLAQSSSRWQYVSLIAYEFTPEICPIIWNSLHLPVLETMEIESTDDELVSPLNMLKNAPTIRSFHALNTWFTWGDTFPLPSANLEELQYSLSYGNFYEMLDSCTRLIHLTVNSSSSYVDDAIIMVTPPRLLSHLRSLSIDLEVSEAGADDSMLTCVLSSLTTPCLVNLTLKQGMEQNKKRPFRAISSFLARSGCSLKSLTLVNVRLSDEEVVSILKQCPDLVDLRIEDPDAGSRLPPIVTQSFLESLHSSKRSNIQTSFSPLVKCLQTLTLRARTFHFAHSAFIDAVSSRWAPQHQQEAGLGVACLRSVELFLPHGRVAVDKSLYESLLPFEAAGMRIVVKQVGRRKYIL